MYKKGDEIIMFVCSECVKPEGQFLFMLLLSYGKCEMCGETAGCVDIHDYNLILKITPNIRS